MICDAAAPLEFTPMTDNESLNQRGWRTISWDRGYSQRAVKLNDVFYSGPFGRLFIFKVLEHAMRP